MKLITTLSALLVLCPLISMGAQTCQDNSLDISSKTVDLSSEFGPIRDQDSIGWCYAFTGADLLTHYLRRTGDIKGDLNSSEGMVSPVGLAALFNKGYFKDHYKSIKNLNSSELKAFNQKMQEKKEQIGESWEDLKVVPEGGFIDTAINHAQAGGYCLEKDAPSESFSLVLANYCSEKNICASDLQEVLNLIYDKARFNKTDINALCDLYEITQAAYPAIPEKNLRLILSKTARDRIFYDLAEAACKNKTKVKKVKPLAVNIAIDEARNESNEKLFVAMDKLLDNGIPVGIAYYADFLKESGAGKNGGHASSIIGKKYDPETCEVKYLLRNTWGPGCGEYQTYSSDYWACLNDDSKKFIKKNSEIANASPAFAKEKYCTDLYPPISRNPKISCDPASGYLSIGKSELKEYLTEISYIE